jgi:hypothetical protein
MADNYIAKKKFDEGVAAYLKGEFKSSIKLLSKALRHDPEFALAYLIRGAAYLKLKSSIWPTTWQPCGWPSLSGTACRAVPIETKRI